jgi:vesicle transport protein SEC22
MVLSTQIARVSDGLPLAQSVDDSATEAALSEYKQQAKLLFRRISPQAEVRCTIESGPKYTFHYQIAPPPGRADAVVFLIITDRSYPRKLAFSYLDELAKEFERCYGAQVAQRNLRPYAFVGFGACCCARSRCVLLTIWRQTHSCSAPSGSMPTLGQRRQQWKRRRAAQTA